MTKGTTKISSGGNTPVGKQTPARTGHLGAWQAAAAAPAMIGSLLLLLVVLAHLGEWELPAVAGWLGSAAALRARSGERLAVRLACGFRRPTHAESALVASVWAAALRRAGVEAIDVDLHVDRSPQPNAFTVGRRSVAVSTGVLQAYRVGTLGAAELLAVLVHELGHVVTGSTRWTLPVAWLAAPARLASRLLGRTAAALVGRQPRPILAMLLIAAVLVAVGPAVHRQDWLVAGLLTGVTLATVLTPLAHAAIGRRSELAADRFAADRGLASPLASALQTLAGDGSASARRHLLASHPSLSERIDAVAGSSPST